MRDWDATGGATRGPRVAVVTDGEDGPRSSRQTETVGHIAEHGVSGYALEHLGSIYTSVDLLLLTSTTDLFAQAVLEAHASGLPVLAVDGGAAAELIGNGRGGCLVPGDPVALGAALRGLARRATLLERLATGGLLAVGLRSWEKSLAQLAYGYACALGTAVIPDAPEVARAA
jgi:phosphatidylinositol alpha 1,6-mannosyltransferase